MKNHLAYHRQFINSKIWEQSENTLKCTLRLLKSNFNYILSINQNSSQSIVNIPIHICKRYTRGKINPKFISEIKH